MLEADNLECVRGERRLFAGLGFRLEAGELLYLQGKNGSGKTSLLRMLIGLLPPEAGEIRWKGESIKTQADEFRADLCYLGHLNAIKEELTPLENLLAARAWPMKYSPKTTRSMRWSRSASPAAKTSPANTSRKARNAASRWPGWSRKSAHCGFSTNPSWRSMLLRSTGWPASFPATCNAAAWP
jgi:ABC-type branched-subunit amino acid transport system ATPase component